jgi:hypothetical protein
MTELGEAQRQKNAGRGRQSEVVGARGQGRVQFTADLTLALTTYVAQPLRAANESGPFRTPYGIIIFTLHDNWAARGQEKKENMRQTYNGYSGELLAFKLAS